MVSPSFLGIQEQALDLFLRQIQKYGADRLHIDFGDGSFIAEQSSQSLLWTMSQRTPLPLELHLMVQQPARFLGLVDENLLMADRKKAWMIIHHEAQYYHDGLFNLIEARGFSSGLALKPQTPQAKISMDLLAKTDLVVVMTVEPGKSGQAMLEKPLAKVGELARLRQEEGFRYLIEVDGGVNEATAQKAVNAGADILVSGGFVQKDPSRISWLKSLKRDS